MELAEKELKRKEERMEIEAAERAKKKNKESLLDDLVWSSFSYNITPLNVHRYNLTCQVLKCLLAIPTLSEKCPNNPIYSSHLY